MKNQIATQISVALFTNMVSALESKLNGQSLLNEVKYNNHQLNKSLKADFDQITEVLQAVVDSFYYDRYIVNSFMPLHREDLAYCKAHNLELLGSIKKVLKFIQ
jgi:hypothetical protein